MRIGTDWIISRAVGHNFSSATAVYDKMDRCMFENKCTEQRWYRVFSKHIQAHHQLTSLSVEFDGWRHIEISSSRQLYTPDYEMTLRRDRATLIKWREHLLDFLHQYMRGISSPKVRCINVDGKGLTRVQMNGLEMKMSRPRSTAEERMPRPKVLLSAVLSGIKARRQTGDEDQNRHLAGWLDRACGTAT